MLPSSLTTLLVALLHPLSSAPARPAPPPPARAAVHFELRHAHAVSAAARVLFADIPPAAGLAPGSGNRTAHRVPARRIAVPRPRSPAAHAAARARSARRQESADLPWDADDVLAPDVESRAALLELAKMTNNAYVDRADPAWYELAGNWTNAPFGWEPDADGFRGHVFATPDNGTVVVSIKGTSAGIVGGGGPTSRKDKLNDNLLFSCCCARVDWTWTTVCGCYRGGSKCDQQCLEDSLVDDSLFYPVGTNLYNNITYMYPDSNIWVIGHSLGGGLAGLIGVTFGVPVVAFESPGERMAARRLHLPMPPSTQHITHVYHTADPIAMGTCNGVLSSCALGGYAMESRCHLGQSVVYDTVTNLSWSVDIRTHGIANVIDRVLAVPWAPSEAAGREVPAARADADDCSAQECFAWEFGDFAAKG